MLGARVIFLLAIVTGQMMCWALQPVGMRSRAIRRSIARGSGTGAHACCGRSTALRLNIVGEVGMNGISEVSDF